jgi:hypothetical protein
LPVSVFGVPNPGIPVSVYIGLETLIGGHQEAKIPKLEYLEQQQQQQQLWHHHGNRVIYGATRGLLYNSRIPEGIDFK